MPEENNLPGSTNAGSTPGGIGPTTGTGATSNAGQSSTGGGAAAAGSNVDALKEQARHAADELRAAAQAKAEELRGRAEEYYDHARERAEGYYGEARQRARTLQEDGEAYVRENPMRAVLTALGAGFILGVLFRR